MSEQETKRQTELLEKLAAAERELAATTQQHADALAAAEKNTLQYNKARQEVLKTEIANKEALLALARAYGNTEDIAAYKAAIAGLKENLEDLAEAQKKAENQFASGKMAFETMAGSVLKLGGTLDTLGGFLDKGTNGFEGFKQAALDSVTSGDLFRQMSLKLIQSSVDLAVRQGEFALAQDKVISNFRRQTGAGMEFNDVIRNTERGTFAAGVSLEDAAEAVQALKNEFTDFTYLSGGQQEAVTKTTTLLNQMGLSFGTQASIMQTATQSMGLSTSEASDFLVDMAGAARSLGLDIAELGSQFEANSEFLSGFGKDGTKIFKELAVQAKALGMEVSDLTGIVDKFTTFDDAGMAVGRLNAILGGPFLNSIDMLNAAMEDPAEAIRMLRDGVNAAGASFEDLGRAEKMAFASALGMSIEDLTNLMGKSNEEIALQTMEQAELAEQAAATQAITEKLDNAMRAFYINLGPVVDALTPVIDKLGSAAQAMGNFLNTSAGIPVFMGLLGALGGAGIGMALGLSAALQAATAAIPAAGPAMALAQGGLVQKYRASALAYAAGGALIGGALGVGGGVALNMATAGGGESAPDQKGAITPRFQEGGTISTGEAIVHPGEMVITGGQGSEVISQKDFKELIDGLKKLTAAGSSTNPIQLAVYVGQDKIDEVVVKAIGSEAGRRVLSPYSMV